MPISPAVPFAGIVRQAIWLARRCEAQLLLLRVGVAAWDVDDGVPDDVAAARLAVPGEPVHQIAAAAQSHDIDLIMMATHEKWRLGNEAEGEGAFVSFSRQSVVARIIERTPCPVWVDTGQGPADAAFHRPLCYLELDAHSGSILAKAGSFAAAMGAPLAVAHATFSTEIHAPGGASPTARMWQESFARTATEKFEQLQRRAGTDAALMIANGEPLEVVQRLVGKAEADLLMVGRWAPSERWTRGRQGNSESDVYRVIRRSGVPVVVFKSEAPAPPPRDIAPSAQTRLVTNMIILVPMMLIVVVALAVGIAKSHPTHSPVTQLWEVLQGK